MTKGKPLGTYVVLFIPWLIAFTIQGMPILSYIVAWLGSFFIFYVSFTGKLKHIPNDRTIAEQITRPLFLMQIIFAGFSCVSSIFYFFDVLGYENFKKVNDLYILNPERLRLTAQCQRYYCLGHASLVAGILTFMKYPKKQKYLVNNFKISRLLLIVSVVTFVISSIFLYFPVLWQLYYQFGSLSFIAGTLALAFNIPRKNVANTVLASTIYVFNFYEAMISGFKEPIIISVLILGIFLYPYYKRLVLFIFVPLLIGLFTLLPTYNRIFRELNWDEGTNVDVSTKLALSAALSGQNNESNWSFFVYRLSEIDMFTTYVKSTPSTIDFYGFTLVKQGLEVLVPRVFWPGKPNTEEMIMERVYDAGVVNRGSIVSAKPAFIVDAYLSYGKIGIILYLFIYGAAAQLISTKAEELFGGYVLGSALIFSGLFQIFWRGISIEFMMNSVFWGYVIMLLIFRFFLTFNILKRA